LDLAKELNRVVPRNWKRISVIEIWRKAYLITIDVFEEGVAAEAACAGWWAVKAGEPVVKNRSRHGSPWWSIKMPAGPATMALPASPTPIFILSFSFRRPYYYKGLRNGLLGAWDLPGDLGKSKGVF
jgi:hypothetical protein